MEGGFASQPLLQCSGVENGRGICISTVASVFRGGEWKGDLHLNRCFSVQGWRMEGGFASQPLLQCSGVENGRGICISTVASVFRGGEWKGDLHLNRCFSVQGWRMEGGFASQPLLQCSGVENGKGICISTVASVFRGGEWKGDLHLNRCFSVQGWRMEGGFASQPLLQCSGVENGRGICISTVASVFRGGEWKGDLHLNRCFSVQGWRMEGGFASQPLLQCSGVENGRGICISTVASVFRGGEWKGDLHLNRCFSVQGWRMEGGFASQPLLQCSGVENGRGICISTVASVFRGGEWKGDLHLNRCFSVQGWRMEGGFASQPLLQCSGVENGRGICISTVASVFRGGEWKGDLHLNRCFSVQGWRMEGGFASQPLLQCSGVENGRGICISTVASVFRGGEWKGDLHLNRCFSVQGWRMEGGFASQPLLQCSGVENGRGICISTVASVFRGGEWKGDLHLNRCFSVQGWRMEGGFASQPLLQCSGVENGRGICISTVASVFRGGEWKGDLHLNRCFSVQGWRMEGGFASQPLLQCSGVENGRGICISTVASVFRGGEWKGDLHLNRCFSVQGWRMEGGFASQPLLQCSGVENGRGICISTVASVFRGGEWKGDLHLNRCFSVQGWRMEGGFASQPLLQCSGVENGRGICISTVASVFRGGEWKGDLHLNRCFSVQGWRMEGGFASQPLLQCSGVENGRGICISTVASVFRGGEWKGDLHLNRCFSVQGWRMEGGFASQPLLQCSGVENGRGICISTVASVFRGGEWKGDLHLNRCFSVQGWRMEGGFASQPLLQCSGVENGRGICISTVASVFRGGEWKGDLHLNRCFSVQGWRMEGGFASQPLLQCSGVENGRGICISTVASVFRGGEWKGDLHLNRCFSVQGWRMEGGFASQPLLQCSGVENGRGICISTVASVFRGGEWKGDLHLNRCFRVQGWRMEGGFAFQPLLQCSGVENGRGICISTVASVFRGGEWKGDLHLNLCFSVQTVLSDGCTDVHCWRGMAPTIARAS
ncbi:hypothetical protein ACOMHN_015137 [Nucella lapillus]